MATTRKKLTAAKARAAREAITTLLDGTEHDGRLSVEDRALLTGALSVTSLLAVSLRLDERNAA